MTNPLTTILEESPDFNPTDRLNAITRLYQREAVADAVLRGKLHPSAILDVISDQGINPDTYLVEFTANAESLVGNRLILPP